ncbi:MAG TPA: class I SAM-dependent methyltransferase [Candidatus Saccharimonadales bacterium]|nr:class I SAM-dependent methyltransferase [Candidatus Saccharimonadales bacterium]
MKIALDLLDLQPGETMLELGCGDGRVLVAAAERGWHVVGYELNPLLALLCWLRTRKYGDRVEVKCRDFWQAKWPATEGIYGFILPRLMEKLDKKVVQEYGTPVKAHVKVVSFAFAIPSKKPVKEQAGVFLYEYK